ncbi:MAG: hypothetical protein KTR21_18165 [Rhodobacteraceae bacterium]|nr:hypothetical protein [Paracoccaceae bacterium]
MVIPAAPALFLQELRLAHLTFRMLLSNLKDLPFDGAVFAPEDVAAWRLETEVWLVNDSAGRVLAAEDRPPLAGLTKSRLGSHDWRRLSATWMDMGGVSTAANLLAAGRGWLEDGVVPEPGSARHVALVQEA